MVHSFHISYTNNTVRVDYEETLTLISDITRYQIDLPQVFTSSGNVIYIYVIDVIGE